MNIRLRIENKKIMKFKNFQEIDIENEEFEKMVCVSLKVIRFLKKLNYVFLSLSVCFRKSFGNPLFIGFYDKII